MQRLFISRHPGSIEWATGRLGCVICQPELTPEQIATLQTGDEIYGTLPVDIACAVCERGARFFFLVFDRTGAARGGELTSEEMLRRGAGFEEYVICRASRS